jgi:excisionase family DNA binding protein
MPVKRRKLAPATEPSAPVTFPAQRLLRVPQAAAYLNCSVWAVRDLLRRAKLGKIRLGKKFLIDRLDLDRFIEQEKMAA